MKLACALLWLAAVCTRAEPVTHLVLTTGDKVEIGATYYPAANRSPAVLLLHDVEATRETWAPLAGLLQHNGIAALAIDLRGHGESIRQLTDRGPLRLNAAEFAPHNFADMLLDVNAAYDWLATQPGVDPKHIGIIGSTLGAQLALGYALFNDDLATLVLLSPVIEYKGLRTDEPMQHLRPVPFRIITSRGDNIPFASAIRLLELRRNANVPLDGRELVVCSGNARGLAMLRTVDGLTTTIVTWLRDQFHLPAPPP